VLGRSGNTGWRNAFASSLELVSKHADLLLVLLLQGHVCLFERVNLLPDQLHLADLGADLMLEAFRLAQVSIELGPDSIKQLVETSGIVRGYTRDAAVRIHGHVENSSDFVAVHQRLGRGTRKIR